MITFYRLIVALLIIIMSLSMASAQDDWGPAEVVWQYGGGWLNNANPCFYPSEHICAEVMPGGDIDYYLYIKPIEHNQDPSPIPMDPSDVANAHHLSPFVTYDGTKLYFSSDREGGYGGLDIWVSRWEVDVWGEPENLGPNINTVENEFGPSLPVDGSELFFSRIAGEAGFVPFTSGVIYKSDNLEGEWSVAEALPEPITINDRAWEPSITSDGSKLYYTGVRPEYDSSYYCFVSERNGDTWAEPEALNENINYLEWNQLDSNYYCNVLSVSIDSSSTSLLLTCWTILECPEAVIKISHLTTVDIDDPESIPQNLELSAYPNPFNARTRINFSLVVQSPVEISIYDITGRLVEVLCDGQLPAGSHSLVWQADNLPSGVYFTRLIAGGNESMRKLSLIK
ncbi:MAG: T9SS type A sorting domain-containing protein [candidate division Zixibacteria bacterium]|nr:T9SS type A sorting domain-containing protein [candidate division Zixibacteria bacterium]